MAMSLPAQAAFGDPHSDTLRILNAVGAFAFELQSAAGRASANGGGSTTAAEQSRQIAAKDFCLQYNLNLKLMNEILKLQQQLTREHGEIRQAQGTDLLRPPSEEQSQLLRKLVVAGYIDHVARLKPQPPGMSHHPNRGAAYVPCRRSDGVAAAAGGARQAWLHRSSCLHACRTDAPPEWLVYHEVTEGRNRGGGAEPRRFLRHLTALDPRWLAPLALASGGGGDDDTAAKRLASSPICRASAPLPEPTPWYSAEEDAVLCYVRPSFGLGSTCWPLPPHACLLRAAPKAGGGEDARDAALEHAVFGRALLEGRVLDGFGPLQRYWAGAPALLSRPHAMADKRCAALVDALLALDAHAADGARAADGSALCKAGLRRAVAARPPLLLEALQRWIVPSKRALVQEVWRVIVASIQQRAHDITVGSDDVSHN
jgi:hypothetical protein